MPMQKVRARYDETPTLSNTLENLVENEKGEKKRKATEGLLWLLRGLQFTCKALQNTQTNASQELLEAFSKSYDVTLKAFHNFVVKGIFAVGSLSTFESTHSHSYFIFFVQVALKACPYRADFFEKLKADPAGGPPASDDHLNEGLNRWLAALDGIVTRVQTFYKAGGHDKGF
jgi:hypothetical protein